MDDPGNRIENLLLDASQEFEQTFTHVKSLAGRLETYSDDVTQKTVDALVETIQSDRYETRKQRFFLYKEAADLLVLITTRYDPGMGNKIINRLKFILINSSSRKQRAVAEALGTLPVAVKGTDIGSAGRRKIKTIKFNRLLNHFNDPAPASFSRHGRTLRFRNRDSTVGCIKFARSDEDAASIALEIEWIKYLRHADFLKKKACHIPEPVIVDQCCLFHLEDIPGGITKDMPSAIYGNPAICYTTIDAYYDYPNDQTRAGFSRNDIKEVFCLNAALLGNFLANGIVHTAVIPLFHNRVQSGRRVDSGFYLWEHGGRLDRWLESCRFPNFSSAGLRDFEHLKPLKNSTQIRHYAGDHLLGLFLVMGSIFRNFEPDKKGVDALGTPYDLRYLFDEDFFHTTMKLAMEKYYEALTGLPMANASLLLDRKLIRMLINAMGVDIHMEETLRIQDQMNMDDHTFSEFLVSRGYSEDAAEKAEKGKEDIILTTGPHLGDFNQPISIPRLIEFLFCFSSLCVTDRYQYENGLIQ